MAETVKEEVEFHTVIPHYGKGFEHMVATPFFVSLYTCSRLSRRLYNLTLGCQAIVISTTEQILTDLGIFQ